jgi:ribosomal protein L7Ae-like RNA K-turn-binding protein
VNSRRPAAPDALLRLLGLATRAGAVLPGTERVREAARAGVLEFAILAADASANSRDKLLPLLDARQIAYTVGYDRDALGRAVGRAPVSAIGITEKKLAGRVEDLLKQLSS